MALPKEIHPVKLTPNDRAFILTMPLGGFTAQEFQLRGDVSISVVRLNTYSKNPHLANVMEAELRGLGRRHFDKGWGGGFYLHPRPFAELLDPLTYLTPEIVHDKSQLCCALYGFELFGAIDTKERLILKGVSEDQIPKAEELLDAINEQTARFGLLRLAGMGLPLGEKIRNRDNGRFHIQVSVQKEYLRSLLERDIAVKHLKMHKLPVQRPKKSAENIAADRFIEAFEEVKRGDRALLERNVFLEEDLEEVRRQHEEETDLVRLLRENLDNH